jgi:hypothetical protein
MDGEAAKQFHEELLALCRKHKMCAVPTYEGEVSAHDPMHIVPLDDFWDEYLVNRLYDYIL